MSLKKVIQYVVFLAKQGVCCQKRSSDLQCLLSGVPVKDLQHLLVGAGSGLKNSKLSHLDRFVPW